MRNLGLRKDFHCPVTDVAHIPIKFSIYQLRIVEKYSTVGLSPDQIVHVGKSFVHLFLLLELLRFARDMAMERVPILLHQAIPKAA